MLASTLPRGQLVCHCTDGIDMQFQPGQLIFQVKQVHKIYTVARPSCKGRWKSTSMFHSCPYEFL